MSAVFRNGVFFALKRDKCKKKKKKSMTISPEQKGGRGRKQMMSVVLNVNPGFSLQT